VTLTLYATIWLALAAFVAGEAGRRRHPAARWAWPVSLAGALLCIVHIVIAFGYHHHWSHASAIEETARQTASVYGVAWGGGVYVNYQFVAIWLVYLWQWRTRPAEPFGGNPAAVWGLRAFFFVIIFNAAVVFATSPMRAVGIVLTLALIASWWPSYESRRTAAGSMRDAR
jgi:hypothetical protein